MTARATALCLSALWPVALTCALRRRPPPLPTTSHNETQRGAAVSSSSSSHTVRRSWDSQWPVFFAKLSLENAVTEGVCHYDVVPAHVLKAVGQHWVDVTLMALTSQRLSEVYPPARTDPTKLPSPDCHPTSSNAPLLYAEACRIAAMESLLATWSAHMMLAGLQKSQSRTAVSATLAICFVHEVVPVLSYLTAFHPPTTTTAAALASPSGKATGEMTPPRASPVRVLHHSIVLLLSSFVAAWQPPAGCHSPLGDSGAGSSPQLSAVEAFLARELCCCVAAFSDYYLDGEEKPQQDAARKVESQFEQVAAQLAHLLGTANCGENEGGAEEGGRPFLNACERYLTGMRESPLPCASPFVGITGVPRRDADPPDVLRLVNEQLNQIGQSGACDPRAPGQ